MAKESCIAAKAEGNTAYAAGNLDLAIEHYTASLEHWDEALEIEVKPKTFSKGDCVVYNSRGFGRVESAFTVMDEYFCKDLGTDKPIWVGDAGGDLKRFSKSDLQPVPQDLFDLRLAVAQNLAAVKLKQEDFELTIKWAEEALRMDGRAPKALMRKGAAMLKSGQAGPASDVLLTAQEVSPKDAEVKRLLREAEKTRAPGWVCANGCCGPWGIGQHLLTPPPNLNTLGKGSTAPPKQLGPMKFGPSTAGQKIVADDDSDSECSTCSSNDNPDCTKKESDDTAPLDTDSAVPVAPAATSEVSAATSTMAAGKAATSCLEPSIEEPPFPTAEEPRKVAAPPAEVTPAVASAAAKRSEKICEKPTAFPEKTTSSPTAATRHFPAIAAALLAAFAVLAAAWQLGDVGAMATTEGVPL